MTTTVIRTESPHLVTGGLQTFRSLDLDESEEQVKAAPGHVWGWHLANSAATVAYVKFYDALAADVTVGTTVPKLTIAVPATSAGIVSWPKGIAFATAITVAATTGVADADTTGPGANEVLAVIAYF